MKRTNESMTTITFSMMSHIKQKYDAMIIVLMNVEKERVQKLVVGHLRQVYRGNLEYQVSFSYQSWDNVSRHQNFAVIRQPKDTHLWRAQ